jgi:pre-mRNA-processing factor 19
VTGVQFHPTEAYLYTASQDKTVRIWHAADTEPASPYKCAHILKTHKADVTAIALHPSHDYLLSLSLDSTWALSDARGGQLICQASHAEVTKGTALPTGPRVHDGGAPARPG